jgi:hypothetical protein
MERMSVARSITPGRLVAALFAAVWLLVLPRHAAGGEPKCGGVVNEFFRDLERARFRSAAETFAFPSSLPPEEVETRTRWQTEGFGALISELGYPSDWTYQTTKGDPGRHELSMHADLGQDFAGDAFYVYSVRFHHEGPLTFIFRFEQETPQCELGSIFMTWPEGEGVLRRAMQVMTAIMEAQEAAEASE